MQAMESKSAAVSHRVNKRENKSREALFFIHHFWIIIYESLSIETV